MGFIYALRSEQEKTKHTSFWAIHFCVPVMGALLFLAYYSLYASTADSKKLKMILEITTTFFPLLISVIVGLNVALEEKASHEGGGFTPEALHHAQEQFFMGDKSRTSNMHFGMGLYITSSIIKQHGGQLVLSNSKKTGGAQVIIKIPY